MALLTRGFTAHAAVWLWRTNKAILYKRLFFRQLGTCTEIHVETKGELGNVLADYDYANIESLKITGVLNDVDFLFIYRMMPNLKKPRYCRGKYYGIADTSILWIYKCWRADSSKYIDNHWGKDVLSKRVEIGRNIRKCNNDWKYCILGLFQIDNRNLWKGSQLKTISHNAYYECTSLTSIEIPASVEAIGNTAFSDCSSLATVTFEKGSRLKTIGNNAYYRCILDLYWDSCKCRNYWKEGIHALFVITDSNLLKGSQLKTIASDSYGGAFSVVLPWPSIEIPASVETIGRRRSSIVTSLATVTFEERFSTLNLWSGASGSYSSSSHFGTYSDYYGAFSRLFFLVLHWDSCKWQNDWSDTIQALFKLITFERFLTEKKTIGGGYSSFYYHGAFSKIVLPWLLWDSCKCRNGWSGSIQI